MVESKGDQKAESTGVYSDACWDSLTVEWLGELLAVHWGAQSVAMLG